VSVPEQPTSVTADGAGVVSHAGSRLLADQDALFRGSGCRASIRPFRRADDRSRYR
jgi:hypothetical protein